MLHLAAKGEALYRIVMPAGAEGKEKLAAEKLGHYLGRMSGARFALVDEGPNFQATGREISVGRTALLEQAAPVQLKTDLGEDGYAVAVKDQRLFLFGQTPTGTLNGVYCLLEEDLGCRWYASRFEPMTPFRPSLRFRPTPRAYRPVLDHARDVYYSEASGAEWVRANRVKPFGSIGNAWGFSHTYNRLVPPGKHFKDHPEYYSEIGGKRVPRQLCLTNPDLEGIILEQLLDHHKAHPETRFYEISPNDGRGYCECRTCKAVNKAAGGTEMGTLLALINRIAEKVEKVYPKVRITTLAYLGTVQPPVNERPRKNVIITLCTDRATWGWPHLYVSETPAFKKGLKAWHEAGATIRIWDYTIVFQYTMQPIPNMPVVSHNLRYYARHNTKGVFMQGAHAGNDGCDRGLMRCWVWSKQLWDPSRDTRELMRDFNHGFYGPAGEAMQGYDDLLWRMWTRHHMNFLQDSDAKMRYDLLYTRQFLDEARTLLNEAERLAGQDRAVLARVRLAKLPLQYVTLNRGPGRDPDGYRRMVDQFAWTAGGGAGCWNYAWAGAAGCGPAGDTGEANDDYDHVPLATYRWDGSKGIRTIALTGHDGLSLKDVVDRWSGDQAANAGIILKADAAGEASPGDRFAWGSSEREKVSERPMLTIEYTPRGSSDRKRIVFQQGADNALVGDYQGCEDALLVSTYGAGNYGPYATSAVGSMPWNRKNNPVRTVMRWDLTALAGRYSEIHSIALTVHNDSSNGSGTAHVYAVKPANAGWVEGTGRERTVHYIESQFSPRDREPILKVWRSLAEGKADGLEAVELGPEWRFRYDPAGVGEAQKWHEPATGDDDWAQIGPGSELAEDKPGWLWLRIGVNVPRDLLRNGNYILYVPGVSGDVDLYVDGRKLFERTAQATGLSPEQLKDEPLVLARSLNPGQRVVVALRMACPSGLKSTWQPAYLVSSPTRLAAPALEQVTAWLKKMNLVRPGKVAPPVPVVGSLSLPRQWTVFGPLKRADPAPAAEVLRSVPKELTIAGKTLRRRAMTAKNSRLDLTDLLGASVGRTAYVFIPFELDRRQEITFGLGADWWFQSWLDGRPLMDTLKHGNGEWPPSPGDYVKTVRVAKGRHVLAVRFLSGSGSSVLAVAGPDGLRAQDKP